MKTETEELDEGGTWEDCTVCRHKIEEETGFSIVDESSKDSYHVCSTECLQQLAKDYYK